MEKSMEVIRFILKIIMWFLILGFGCNFILQKISYSFYKNTKKMIDISNTPQFIQFTDTLTGYGNNLDSEKNNKVILFLVALSILPITLWGNILLNLIIHLYQ